MDISILIPVYNYNAFKLVKKLSKCAEVLKTNYEILVFDDASTEIFEENILISSFPKTQLIVAKKNLGRTEARKYLAKKAIYNYLLFLDADVLPKKDNFLLNYINASLNNRTDIIFGGILYEDHKPSEDRILRWKYGKKREAKTVEKRKVNPFFIISQNFLIKKTLFNLTNPLFDNLYGLDNIFSFNLKKNNAIIIHIENPVVHFGLEPNEVFLSKSLNAIETLIYAENHNLIAHNFTTLQKFYKKLKNLNLTFLINTLVSPLNTTIKKNLLSNNPNLFLFDLYRLNYYIAIKDGK